MTQVINIKDIATASPLAIVDESGTRHEMKAATVQSFIDNITLIEQMGTQASAVDEMNAMIKMILRAFPTLTDEAVRQWELGVIQHISDLARGTGGEIVTNDENSIDEAKETGNAQTAT